MIAAHIDLAREAEEWIEAAPDFELLAPRRLALLNFRYHPRGVDDAAALDRLNERLLETLNDSGRLYLTQNRVRGAFALRLSIGQTATMRRHVEAAWRRIQDTARALAPA
jgi:aromatic-L-amino-acid decarboxylase